MTWEKLIEIEPRLLTLYEQAKNHKPAKGFCANRIWYGRNNLKAQMMELVGFGAPGPLGTSEAYDTAYRKIYDALPNCMHDGWC